MEAWRERMQRSGGAIRCRGNCPVHTSCEGSIRPRDEADIAAAAPIDGYAPLAQCERCQALFGFEHAALHYLEHPISWKQSPHEGKPPGIP